MVSEKNNNNIHINDKLNMDDTIIFKEYNSHSIPGIYILEIIPIMQETDFTTFESLTDQKMEEKIIIIIIIQKNLMEV